MLGRTKVLAWWHGFAMLRSAAHGHNDDRTHSVLQLVDQPLSDLKTQAISCDHLGNPENLAVIFLPTDIASITCRYLLAIRLSLLGIRSIIGQYERFRSASCKNPESACVLVGPRTVSATAPRKIIGIRVVGLPSCQPKQSFGDKKEYCRIIAIILPHPLVFCFFTRVFDQLIFFQCQLFSQQRSHSGLRDEIHQLHRGERHSQH